MEANISRSGRIRKSNPIFRDYKLYDDGVDLEKMGVRAELRAKPNKESLVKKHSPSIASTSKPSSSLIKMQEPTEEVRVIKVMKEDAHAFMQFKHQMRADFNKLNKKLTDEQFHILLKHEWETMSNHEKRLLKRRAIRARSKKAALKEEASKPKTAVPPRALPSHRTRLNANPSGAATFTYLAGKRMRQVGAKMKALADKEDKNGQINPNLKGSLTEILDNLLVGMSTLICLTTQIPQLDVIPRDRLSEIHNNTLGISKNYIGEKGIYGNIDEEMSVARASSE